MNDLQVALAAAGIAVVAAVWGYNFWQEQKHRKLADKIFNGGRPDVLLGGQNGDETEQVAPATSASSERVEPAVTPLPDGEPQTPPAPPAAWADAIADCTLRIDLDDAVAATELWALQAAWAEQLGRAPTWMGYDAAAAVWRRLDAHNAGRYAHFAVALQLADRQGPIADTGLAIFIDGVRRIAEQFAGSVDLPQQAEVLEHAQALDGFCAGVDVQLVVNVIETAGGSFAGTKLRGLAEAAGLVLRGDGRFHGCDDAGGELFTLGNLGAELFEAESLRTLATVGVTFALDVPRVADGAAAFDRMVAAARLLAQGLGGMLVDAQRHALNDGTIAGIRTKIGEIQRQMTAHRIEPGSPRALRLFS